MSKSSDRRLSIADAARLLYRTDAPSDQQIGRVYERMKAGAIRVHDTSAAPRHWTTTEKALADYVAVEMVKRQDAVNPVAVAKPRGEPLASRTRGAAQSDRARDAKTLKDAYHNIWRDAFLAVLLRRRMAHRSARFHHGVVVCQIALLIGLIGIALGAIRLTMRPIAPEHMAIERWIEQATDTYSVTRWHPTQTAADGQGVTVEVEYRYTKQSRKPINTRRTFRVIGDSVSEMSHD